jgi:hypothetical protein
MDGPTIGSRSFDPNPAAITTRGAVKSPVLQRTVKSYDQVVGWHASGRGSDASLALGWHGLPWVVPLRCGLRIPEDSTTENTEGHGECTEKR